MSVEFQHLGLTITEPSDILEFYQDILEMDIRNKFTLKQNIASQIFHREQDIEVIVGTIGNLSIELFLSEEKSDVLWDHLCIVSENRQALIAACQAKDFPVTVIERDPFDIVFIRDRSGNNFEIKQA